MTLAFLEGSRSGRGEPADTQTFDNGQPVAWLIRMNGTLMSLSDEALRQVKIETYGLEERLTSSHILLGRVYRCGF